MPLKPPHRSKKSPLDALGVTEDPERLRSDFMEGWRNAFETDRTNIIPAFMALASAVAYRWSKGDEPDLIEVPFWAAQAVTKGFMIYHDAVKAGGKLTFGEAFDLEGGGRGKQRRLSRELYKRRDRDIALAVALRVESGETREAAVWSVAEEYALSDKRVWTIWSAYGKHAIQALRRFRTLKTSRSPRSDSPR